MKSGITISQYLCERGFRKFNKSAFGLHLCLFLFSVGNWKFTVICARWKWTCQCVAHWFWKDYLSSRWANLGPQDCLARREPGRWIFIWTGQFNWYLRKYVGEMRNTNLKLLTFLELLPPKPFKILPGLWGVQNMEYSSKKRCNS